MTVAIIGAGMAGLSAARRLSEAGKTVRLFDKGRGPGGRMSTRRAETPSGEVRWDHGAQFFTARSGAFSDEVVRLRDAGALERWRPRLADIRRRNDGWTIGVRPSDNDRDAMFVGTPSMNAVIKAMAEGLDVSWARRVSAIRSDGAGKVLGFEDGGEEGPFDAVICAVPAEQAAELLSDASPALAAEAAGAMSAPCWAVMIAFADKTAVKWDAASVSDGSLAWIARNSSKPGRAGDEAWVLHASPDWSRTNVDMAKEAVAEQLVSEFREITGLDKPAFAAAHRWLYAKVEKPAGSRFGWDESTGITTVGDWRTGPRVEEAWLSGHACAEFLLG